MIYVTDFHSFYHGPTYLLCIYVLLRNLPHGLGRFEHDSTRTRFTGLEEAYVHGQAKSFFNISRAIK